MHRLRQNDENFERTLEKAILEATPLNPKIVEDE